MPASPITHIGILVHDLDAAKARFREVLGVSFSEDTDFADVGFEHGGLVLPEDGTYSFSLEGPPFIELLQSQPNGGIYGNSQPEGIHHIALFVPDTGARLDELALAGIDAEYRITPRASSLLAAYLSAGSLHGCRIELLNRAPNILGYDAHAIVERAFGS
jgi:catechol 2,3-dioxygenase-like lactoylglutathione lyase family enzyme